MPSLPSLVVGAVLATGCLPHLASADGPGLRTRWTADVDRTSPWLLHPRPQFERERWMSLNGSWEYAIKAMEEGLDFPAKADGVILVPFPLESALSGVERSIDAKHRLFYRTRFAVGKPADGTRLVLHFEAVDWGTKVFLNGRSLGDHTGGYEPFSFDITEDVRAGDNELIVEAWDPCDEPDGGHEPPRGKQVRHPEGIWYTSVTGIWQSVWLEWMPERSLDHVTFHPDLAAKTLAITPEVRGTIAPEARVEVVVRWPDNPDGPPAAEAQVKPGETASIAIPNPLPWSPESPKLYPVELRYGADRVKSYVAFRSVEVKPDASGTQRVFLNGQPYFMLGTLDQGWWPDGLYTAPTPEAMVYDLEVTKALGFNTIRKHVKVEPATWYAACDRLGLLVWQDMPSSGPYIGPNDPDAKRGEVSAAAYERELLAMVERLSFHPSIVVWVPFNEGWGQFDTARIVGLVKSKDPTRLVNNASGWSDRGVGDLFDVHDYSASLAGHCPKGDGKRAVVIGEFGGLGLPVPGHLWRESGWGYRSFKDPAELTEAYVRLLEEVADLRYDGLCAAIYTQTTDVEVEVNGLMTYDRDLIKPNSARVRVANDRVTAPVTGRREVSVVVPTAQEAKDIGWRFTLEQPAEGWAAPGFDDSGWRTGPGGFGTAGTPGALVGTEWSSAAIWLRRTITIPGGSAPTHLVIHHDEDAGVFLDGKPIATLGGFTSGYARLPLGEAARSLLTPGQHTLAIACKQSRGGQFIDAGFATVRIVP